MYFNKCTIALYKFLHNYFQTISITVMQDQHFGEGGYIAKIVYFFFISPSPLEKNAREEAKFFGAFFSFWYFVVNTRSKILVNFVKKIPKKKALYLHRERRKSTKSDVKILQALVFLMHFSLAPGGSVGGFDPPNSPPSSNTPLL